MYVCMYACMHVYIYIWCIYIYTYVYMYIYIYMSSHQNPWHVTSCYCHCYRVWGGGLSLSRVLWISAYSRSNMKQKANPKQARKCIEELFCWFQVLRQQFTFLSFCIHLHACSSIFLSCACIFLSFCIHVPSFSFHYPFMFLSFVLISLNFPFIYIYIFLLYSFQCAFMSFHLPFLFFSICMHVPFILHSYPLISFLKLWKWL